MNDHRIAINLFDLDRLDKEVLRMLLGGKLKTSGAIRTDPKRNEEVAIEFSCDTLTAASICDTIRGHDRRNGIQPTRCYLMRNDVWIRLSSATDLTIVVNAKVLLNPAVFSGTAMNELAPATAKRVTFGG